MVFMQIAMIESKKPMTMSWFWTVRCHGMVVAGLIARTASRRAIKGVTAAILI